MYRKNRKTKSSSRRTRRKKRSKLFAALVIEAISAVALFGAYRFAQDIRSSQQTGRIESSEMQQVTSPAAWDQLVANSTPQETSEQTPVFRISRLVGFAPEGS